MARKALEAYLIISAVGDAGAQDVGVDAPVERLDGVAVLGTVRADHDAVRLEEVLDRSAFPQELGVRGIVDIRRAQGFEIGHHAIARTDRHGALHDEEPLAAVPRDLVEGAVHA